MSRLPTRRLMREDSPILDPRRRAALATQLFVAVYLGGLVLMVLVQYGMEVTSSGLVRTVPVLQRLHPGQGLGWLEVPLGIGVGLGVVIVQLVLRPLWAWVRRLEETVQGLIGKPTIMNCLAMASCSAMAEEVFFRGILQQNSNIIVASLLFGLMHYLMWQWAIFAAVMGFVFGSLYTMTNGGLLAPVIAHFTWNFLGLWQMSRECPADAPPLPVETASA